MLRGLWRLTWLEIKIFVREPLGLIGTVAVPVLIFVVLGRVLGPRLRNASPDVPRFVGADLPIFVSLLIAASAVPTARFAQPIGTVILYPMLGLSGLFVPVESLPPMLQAIARALPLTYAVSLLRGIWHGEGWSAHVGDVAILTLMFLICTALSARVFRWE